MANTKDYAMREMILDRCFSTGKEYTREELMAIVNKELEQRDMLPIRSRNTFSQDIIEMNEKLRKIYGVYGIVFDDRHKKRYYRYRDGIDSIYNRELTAEEIERLQEVRSLLQGLRGMPQLEWIDEMAARFDQNIVGSERSIASFEDGTPGDAQFFLQCFNAISHKQVLTIKYGPFGAEAKERIIHPYFLKQFMRRWYLCATIEGKEFITIFALDRILSVRKNTEVAFRETTIDFNHYFDDIVGVTHPDNGVVEQIIIEGDSWAEYYLRTLPIHPLQQLESLGEKGCRVTLSLMVNRELEREILSYGEHLKVIAPEHLRERMRQLLAMLQEDYQEE
jgi:predicted DNA-binding transcriptional regulator YafY